MGAWNDRKRAILELLSGQELTTDEVAKALGCCRSNAATSMLRLWHGGHLQRRESVEGEVQLGLGARGKRITRPLKVFRYSITGQGEKRLKRISGKEEDR